jgi:HK97 gp10 family phage protein
MKMEISGFRELNQAIVELGKTTGKNVLRRVARKRLMPMRDAAEANAPERTGILKSRIIVGTRLARSQRGARGVHTGGGNFRTDAKNGIRMHMGPGQEPQAIQSEFGNFRQAAQPFMRPAFDAEAEPAIDGIGDDLWTEIAATAARAARKAARAASRG